MKFILSSLALCFWAASAWAQTIEVPMPVQCAATHDGKAWLLERGYKPSEMADDANGDNWVLMEDAQGKWILLFEEDGMLCKVGGGIGWKRGSPF